LADVEENLRVLEEQKAKHIMETDIPLSLIREGRKKRKAVADLQAQLAKLAVSPLCQMLTTRLNESELRMLCSNLGVNYDDLPGKGTDDKAKKLLSDNEHPERIAKFICVCVKLCPNIFDPPPPPSPPPPHPPPLPIAAIAILVIMLLLIVVVVIWLFNGISRRACHCPGHTQKAITCLIQAEAEAATKEDIQLINDIFAFDATIENKKPVAGENSYWTNPVERYETEFEKHKHCNTSHNIRDMNVGKTTATVTITSTGMWGMGDTCTDPYDRDAIEEWTFRKDADGCWRIASFTFNIERTP
jgi:hypothetical protein